LPKSYQRFQHFALAAIFGLVPLLPPGSAQASASSAPVAHAASAPLSAARIKQIRDSGPPVMERAAQFEATATPHYSPATNATTVTPLAVTNSRLYREVFGFAFASSLGDPTIGYQSWNMSLLSTVAYFGIHVDWTGEFSGGSALNTWNDPNGPVPGLISKAHANGTKVVLTIAMFDSTSGTPNMCSALQRYNITIQRTVAEIQAKGVDGVNVDYESNNTNCTDPATGRVTSSQIDVHGLRGAPARGAAGRGELPVGGHLLGRRRISRLDGRLPGLLRHRRSSHVRRFLLCDGV